MALPLFQPNSISPSLDVPSLVFTTLKTFNKVVAVDSKSFILPQVLNQTESLTFKYNKASFSIGVCSIGLP